MCTYRWIQQGQLYALCAHAIGDPGASLLEQLDDLQNMDFDTPFPFTALSTPVYSLATNGTTAGGGPSMNIVTYAALVSISPRTFAVGLCRNTLTWQNFLDTNTGVLQILRKKHLPLVELLGSNSGNTIDKITAIQVRHTRLSTLTILTWISLFVESDAVLWLAHPSISWRVCARVLC